MVTLLKLRESKVGLRAEELLAQTGSGFLSATIRSQDKSFQNCCLMMTPETCTSTIQPTEGSNNKLGRFSEKWFRCAASEMILR